MNKQAARTRVKLRERLDYLEASLSVSVRTTVRVIRDRERFQRERDDAQRLLAAAQRDGADILEQLHESERAGRDAVESREAMRAALVNWGQHSIGCPAADPDLPHALCTCGLRLALGAPHPPGIHAAAVDAVKHLYWKHVVTNHDRHTDDVGCLGYDCEAITGLRRALGMPTPD